MSLAPPDDTHASALGMHIVRAGPDEVLLEWEISSQHRQPMGIVHGGVYCSAVETACSVGATIAARERDPAMGAVGLENQTSFIRAARSGKLSCLATPLTRGRRTQVWQAEIRDEEGRLIATGRLRLLVVERESPTGRG